MNQIIKRIQKDPQLAASYNRIDAEIFKKLKEFNIRLMRKMTSERFFFDSLILRNLVCLYFNPADYPPFSNIKKVPTDQLLQVISSPQSSQIIDKLSEVLLQIVFEKLDPTSPEFRLKHEINKIDFCLKLYSLKRVHTKRRLISTAYKGGKLARLYKQVHQYVKSKALDQATIDRMGYEISRKFRISLIAMEDCWFIVSLNEMIGIMQVNEIGGTFFQSLSEDDLKKFAGMMSAGDASKLPIVMEVILMERKRNEVLRIDQVAAEVVMRSRSKKSSSKENRSFNGSDFSFNLDALSSGSIKFI